MPRTTNKEEVMHPLPIWYFCGLHTKCAPWALVLKAWPPTTVAIKRWLDPEGTVHTDEFRPAQAVLRRRDHVGHLSLALLHIHFFILSLHPSTAWPLSQEKPLHHKRYSATPQSQNKGLATSEPRAKRSLLVFRFTTIQIIAKALESWHIQMSNTCLQSGMYFLQYVCILSDSHSIPIIAVFLNFTTANLNQSHFI